MLRPRALNRLKPNSAEFNTSEELLFGPSHRWQHYALLLDVSYIFGLGIIEYFRQC